VRRAKCAQECGITARRNFGPVHLTTFFVRKANYVWNVDPSKLQAVEEIENGPDRSAAIVSVALVEAAIYDIISERLKFDDSACQRKVRKDLLDVNAPLGPISSRVKLAYLLRMLSEDAYLDLTTIAEIRNKFAHYPLICSFSADQVKSRCETLKLIRQDKRIHKALESDSTSFESTLLSNKGEQRLVSISVRNSERLISEPRGKFMLTIRLLLAAFYIYTNHKHFKLDLSSDPVII
jgi:DNA-binding MltR family transcriptional regulator